VLFLYRPRQTWMPYRRPRPRMAQDAYNAQLQRAYAATRQVSPSAPAVGAATAAQDPVTRLKELAQLHEDGVLDDGEFAALKAKVLGGGEPPG